MASATFDTIVKQAQTLSSEEQHQLRTLIDTWLTSMEAQSSEDEFEHGLAEAGLLTVPVPQGAAVEQYRLYTPVPITGKLVSETLIEERR